MGPKKKVDPEQLKAQFLDFQASQEYECWNKLAQKKKDFSYDINEGTGDIHGPWQAFHDQLFIWAKDMLKVKTKLKEIKHEWIRTAFFIQQPVQLEIPEQWKVDGVPAGVVKEFGDRCRNIRNQYVKIWRQIEEQLQELDENNFQQARKSLQKDISELLKLLGPHIKKKGSHEEVTTKMKMVMLPLTDLLGANMRLSFFEVNYDKPENREECSFKQKARIDEFCKSLQECFRVLFMVEDEPDKKIKANPEVQRIFNKLKYKNWDQKENERFYLNHLNNALHKLRNNLIALTVKGEDYWRVPLSYNEQFLEDCRRLIDAELIAEKLLGNQLKRDQFQFVFECIKIIEKTAAGKNLKEKRENIFFQTIPQLVIFRTISQMRQILDKKKEDLEKEQKEKELEKLNQEDDLDQSFVNSPLKQNTEVQFSPQNTFKQSINGQSSLKMLEVQNTEELERLKYGRYWLWDNYVSDDKRYQFEQATELIRHINIAVQQDIEDAIITKGLQSFKDREKDIEKIKQDLKVLQKLKIEHSKLSINERRPPNLWNDPIIVEQEHQYRANSDPHECYCDGRIQEFMTVIEDLGNHILNYSKDRWQELVIRSIDIINSQYNPNPSTLYTD